MIVLLAFYTFTEVALPSGSNDRKVVEVQVLLPAPPLKAFVYAALSVFLPKISTEITCHKQKMGAQHKAARLPSLLYLKLHY